MTRLKENQHLYGVILAAGEAARFGSPKQLASFDGASLLQRADELARAVAGTRRIVVTGAHVTELLATLTALGTAFAHNPDWSKGPGGSIAAGVRALPGDCAAVLIWHVDQPLLGSEELQAMRDAWLRSPTHIVTAEFADSFGAPVIFPRRTFDTLLSLNPRHGAKHTIASDSMVIRLPIQSAAFDIDTPDDLARAERRLAASRARDSRNVRN